MTPSLAKKVEIVRNGNEVHIEVDGEEFPWYTSKGVATVVEKSDAPSITLTIPAESVEIRDELGTI